MVTQAVGLYISVPFCRAKCTFCNFASAAFPPERMEAYVDRLVCEIHELRPFALAHGLHVPEVADTVFFGGGTPSLLAPDQFARIVTALRSEYEITGDAEITVEAAPGQIADDLLEAFCRSGVNRISLGVQSFVDAEARAVGRLHTSEQCLHEIERLQRAGIRNRNVDLIAGLPHQNALSWAESLSAAIGSGVEHVSVYMLEVDEESTLGREVTSLRAESQLAVLGQHARYGAAAVPAEDVCVDLYEQACRTLAASGVAQYEISNFARPGFASRHNCKYWTRAPYAGFGLDAHSMLRHANDSNAVARFARADDLSVYLQGEPQPAVQTVAGLEAFEEEVFLRLRLTEGLPLAPLRVAYGDESVNDLVARARELQSDDLMTVDAERLCLTAKGRVLSSSVFAELLAVPA